MALKSVDDVGDVRLVLFTLDSPSLIDVSDTFYTRRGGTSRGDDFFSSGFTVSITQDLQRRRT